MRILIRKTAGLPRSLAAGWTNIAWSRSGMIDTFRYLKVSGAPTAITSQVQPLSHSNTALPNMVNAVNANQVADRHQAEAKVTLSSARPPRGGPPWR